MITHIFFHSSDHHLYYNMISWVYVCLILSSQFCLLTVSQKGRKLETRLRSSKFALIVLIFAICSGLLMSLLSLIPLFSTEVCAIGISGVLFALNVILSQDAHGQSTLLGLSIPLKHIYWVEILIIQLIYPNASLLGHFSGIIIGLLYTKGYFDFLINPLSSIIDNFLVSLGYDDNLRNNEREFDNGY